MKRDQVKEDYTGKFIDCQQKLKDLLVRPPVGCQNWSYQKSVNFKKALKKAEQSMKLVPKSGHTDFLKMEQMLGQIKEYYK